LKSAPYVFMTDFVGWLPIDDSPSSREAYVAADYNHENISHIERYPYVRDAAVFVGSQDDVVPRHFGPELPFMPDWIAKHFDFPGYVLPFDPADYADTERVRRRLGFDPATPLIVASVGGAGGGGPPRGAEAPPHARSSARTSPRRSCCSSAGRASTRVRSSRSRG